MPSSFTPQSVLDISGGNIDVYLKSRLRSSLIDAYENSETPYLPEEFLYLKKGLYIWRDLVYNPKYYQTHDEINLFRKNGHQVASYIPDNCTLIDLGSGNLGKVETLLSVLEKRGKQVTYLAVDINREYLEYDISSTSQQHRNVTCQGLYGTFDDALAWCKGLPSPKAFLSFGSTFFRGTEEEGLITLQSWKKLMQPGDIMLVGADNHCTPRHHDKIWQMYHSDEAGWQRLWDNGFSVANDVIGEEWFRSSDWKLDAVIDTKNICQHRFRFRAQRDLELGSSGIVFKKGDELGWLDAHKFSKELIYKICQEAGLEVVRTWQAEDSETHHYMIALPGTYNNLNGRC